MLKARHCVLRELSGSHGVWQQHFKIAEVMLVLQGSSRHPPSNGCKDLKMAWPSIGGWDRQTGSLPKLLRTNVVVGSTCLTMDVGVCYKILKFSSVVPTAGKCKGRLVVVLKAFKGNGRGLRVLIVNRLHSPSSPNLFTKFRTKADWGSSDIKLWKLD